MSNEILTQDEIDELLISIKDGENTEVTEDTENTTPTKEIKTYDFMCPDVLSKEQRKYASTIFDIFCKNFTNEIRKKTRRICLFRTACVDQLNYQDFRLLIPSPSVMFLAKYNFGQFLVQIDQNILFPMLGLTCKDEKEIQENYRFYESSDPKSKKFIKKIQKPFLSILKKTLTKELDKFSDFKCNIKNWKLEKNIIGTNLNFENLLLPNDMVCLVTIDSVFNGIGMITVCIPCREIIKIINEARGKQMESKKSIDINLVQGTKVPVEVVLGGTNISLNDVSALGEGSIIELDKNALSPVDIKVNGKIVGHGEVVVIDDNFGVRLTDFETSDEKPTY